MDNTHAAANPAPPAIRVGLPHTAPNEIADAAGALNAPTLVSTGSLWRTKRGGFQAIGLAAWRTMAALDSAGFVAMIQGGYRWDVADYVEFVVTNSGDGAMPFPWEWWSAMDYCCEAEIAADRETVEARIDATIESYREHIEELAMWRDEGVTDVPDPLPILQGRTPADYIRCARELTDAIDRTYPCTCADGDEHCSAEWHRTRKGLPELVGLGSVCRRDLHGPEGLLTVLDALHAELPPHVRLHLFGVKGSALSHLAKYGDRIASIDSMAWDYRATVEAREINKATATEHGVTMRELKTLDREEGEKIGPHWYSNTNERRAAHLVRWYTRQAERRDAAFGTAADVAELIATFTIECSEELVETVDVVADDDTDTDTDTDGIDYFHPDHCPFCGQAVELDGLWAGDDVFTEWLPCCYDAREAVERDGWESFRCGAATVADDMQRCTGLPVHKVDTDAIEGVGDSLCIFRLEVLNPGSKPGWQTDLFGDVDDHHRHHSSPQGWRFGIAVYNGFRRVGVAVVGNPVSRMLAKAEPHTWEITRVCTWGDARQRRNAASKLYAAACDEARERGITKLITYTIADVEDGASLKASGFHVEVERTRGGSWNRKGRAREDKAPTAPKTRWARYLTAEAEILAALADGPKPYAELSTTKKHKRALRELHAAGIIDIDAERMVALAPEPTPPGDVKESERKCLHTDPETGTPTTHTDGDTHGPKRTETEGLGELHGERTREDDADGESRRGASCRQARDLPELVDARSGSGEAHPGHPATESHLSAADDHANGHIDRGTNPRRVKPKRPAKPERETTPGGVVLAEPAKVPNMSPSALSTMDKCARKWWLNKVARLDMPATESLRTGIAVHNILEAHLNGEELPTYNARLHGIAKAGLHLLPEPGSVLVEQWVGRKEHPMDCGGLPYKGKIDLFDPDGLGVRNAGPKGLIWIGDHKTSSDPSKWGLRADELATNHQALSYAYGIVRSRGIEPPERIALTHFYYRTRGLPMGSRVDAPAVPWENVERSWAHFESRGREMRAMADEVDSRRIRPNPNACNAYNTLCPFAGVCNDSPTAAQKRRLTRVLTPTEKSTMPPDTDTASKSSADVAAWLTDGDAAPTTTRTDAARNPALAGSDGGINPPDAAPELNPTKALMNEVAGHARNTLGILKGSMPEASFSRIFERNGLDYNDANRAYVLSVIPAHIDGGDVREGKGSAPALTIAPDPKPEPRPAETLATPNADAAAESSDLLGKIDASPMPEEHKRAISTLYRATFEPKHKLGRVEESAAKDIAKEAAGWKRATKKRWEALLKDAELIGALTIDPGGAIVRKDDDGGSVGSGAGSTGEAAAAPAPVEPGSSTGAPPAIGTVSGRVSATTPNNANAPKSSGKPTPPKLPDDPAPRWKEGLEEHTDGEPRGSMPYTEGSQKAADWFAGWDYGAAQAAYVTALAEWELAESKRIEAERIAAEEAAANKALSAKHTNDNPRAATKPKATAAANALTGLALFIDCTSNARSTLSLSEYLSPFERAYVERNPKCNGYAYSEPYNVGAKGVASLLVAHLAKHGADFGTLFVSSRHPAYSEVMAVLECVPGVEVVRAVGASR